MRSNRAPLRVALLGSAVALIALTPAMGANLSRADMEQMAITGRPASALQNGAVSTIRQAGATYTDLYNFAGGTSDGGDSSAEVTLDKSGNIYGTTAGGGANGFGTVFELTSSGTESLLHSFGATGDGQNADGAVLFDASGNMYGTTDYGGANGDGTIWEIAAGGTYSILHSFNDTGDGDFIRGRLVSDNQGNLYGTALFGGASGDGVVFQYNISTAALTVLHAFSGTDGEFPEHGVARDKSGNLYGVTAFGGSSGAGTVYEIAANGTFTSLYSFTGKTDGGFLYGTVAVDNKGNIYGSTVDDGGNEFGTVFKLTSSGTLTTLYNFTGTPDGANPEGDMLLDKKDLYSTADDGGANGTGGIYKVTLKGKETMLSSFAASTGGGYSAGLTRKGKTFYGTTSGGGTNGYGVVFSQTK